MPSPEIQGEIPTAIPTLKFTNAMHSAAAVIESSSMRRLLTLLSAKPAVTLQEHTAAAAGCVCGNT